MADAVGLWVIVYFCVTSVNTKDKCFVKPTDIVKACRIIVYIQAIIQWFKIKYIIFNIKINYAIDTLGTLFIA